MQKMQTFLKKMKLLLGKSSAMQDKMIESIFLALRPFFVLWRENYLEILFYIENVTFPLGRAQ